MIDGSTSEDFMLALDVPVSIEIEDVEARNVPSNNISTGIISA